MVILPIFGRSEDYLYGKITPAEWVRAVRGAIAEQLPQSTAVLHYRNRKETAWTEAVMNPGSTAGSYHVSMGPFATEGVSCGLRSPAAGIIDATLLSPYNADQQY